MRYGANVDSFHGMNSEVNAVSIQVVIHKFVKELFNCQQCRYRYMSDVIYLYSSDNFL